MKSIFEIYPFYPGIKDYSDIFENNLFHDALSLSPFDLKSPENYLCQEKRKNPKCFLLIYMSPFKTPLNILPFYSFFRWNNSCTMGRRDRIHAFNLCKGLCEFHYDRLGSVLAHGLQECCGGDQIRHRTL